MELEIFRNGRRLRSLTFGHSVLRIGKFPTCDIRLEGRGVKGLHAVIEPDPEGDGFTISQIGDGILRVNGGPCSKAKMRQGQHVEVGSFHIVVRSESDDPLADVRMARRSRHFGAPSHFGKYCS